MPVVSGFASTTIDCPDPVAQLRFYRELTGWRIVWESEEFCALSPDGSSFNCIGFQKIEGYEAPEWPSRERPQQVHLDFYVEDLDKGQDGALALGARAPETQPQPDRWRVLIDPAGHPFCLCPPPQTAA
jgi:catechol 2,3-dioxygenase-like lactoylglutathione lyase family enzyme